MGKMLEHFSKNYSGDNSKFTSDISEAEAGEPDDGDHIRAYNYVLWTLRQWKKGKNLPHDLGAKRFLFFGGPGYPKTRKALTNIVDEIMPLIKKKQGEYGH